MFVHVALSILGLGGLLLQLLLLGRLRRLENQIQNSTDLQLGLAQMLMTEISGAETRISIRPIGQGAEEESAPEPERFSLQSEIDRYVTGNMYGEEDD